MPLFHINVLWCLRGEGCSLGMVPEVGTGSYSRGRSQLDACWLPLGSPSCANILESRSGRIEASCCVGFQTQGEVWALYNLTVVLKYFTYTHLISVCCLGHKCYAVFCHLTVNVSVKTFSILLLRNKKTEDKRVKFRPERFSPSEQHLNGTKTTELIKIEACGCVWTDSAGEPSVFTGVRLGAFWKFFRSVSQTAASPTCSLRAHVVPRW